MARQAGRSRQHNPAIRGRYWVVLTLTLSRRRSAETLSECQESRPLLWRQAGQHADELGKIAFECAG